VQVNAEIRLGARAARSSIPNPTSFHELSLFGDNENNKTTDCLPIAFHLQKIV